MMTVENLPEATPSYTPGAERLLAAAADLFYRNGIHAVGVDTIAAAAGVTKKTLYDRFGSKDALAVAYLRRRDLLWRDYLERGLAQLPEGSTARVLAIFDLSEQWAHDYSGKGCSATNARGEMGDPEHPIVVEAMRQKKWMRAVIEQSCRDAGITNAERVANSLTLLYEGCLVTGGMGTFAEPFAVGREAAALMLDAARATAGVRSASRTLLI